MADQDWRPANCRFRLQDEGKAYPRSSCTHCGKSVLKGLGTSCTWLDKVSGPEKISGMLAAIVLISQAKPKPGDEGTCACPVCQGVLSWWWGGPRAIRARCATADCLAFMS